MPDWVTSDDYLRVPRKDKEKTMSEMKVLEVHLEGQCVEVVLEFPTEAQAWAHVVGLIGGGAAAVVAKPPAPSPAPKPARTAKVSPVPAPVPAPVDDDFAEPASDGEPAPAELLSAPNFREVIQWFLAQKIADPAVIEAKCRAWASEIPPIQRLGDALPDRIKRALTVLGVQTG